MELEETDKLSVEKVKEALHIDSDIDDVFIEGLIDAGEDVIRDAVNPYVELSVYRGIPRFQQALLIWVDYMYFNRGTWTGSTGATTPAFLMLVQSLRYKKDLMIPDKLLYEGKEADDGKTDSSEPV